MYKAPVWTSFTNVNHLHEEIKILSVSQQNVLLFRQFKMLYQTLDSDGGSPSSRIPPKECGCYHRNFHDKCIKNYIK